MHHMPHLSTEAELRARREAHAAGEGGAIERERRSHAGDEIGGGSDGERSLDAHVSAAPARLHACARAEHHRA